MMDSTEQWGLGSYISVFCLMMWFNSLRARPNRPHLADGIFKCIFFNENILILIKISMKFISKDPIDNIPALVQIMSWHQPGGKPLSEPMITILLTHISTTRPLVGWINSLGPSDAIWWQRSLSTLAQVMACCLKAQAITWTNVDLSSVRSSDIHLGASSQEIPQPSITEIICKIKYLKFHSNFPGANELNIFVCSVISQHLVQGGGGGDILQPTCWKMCILLRGEDSRAPRLMSS